MQGSMEFQPEIQRANSTRHIQDIIRTVDVGIPHLSTSALNNFSFEPTRMVSAGPITVQLEFESKKN